MGQKGLLWPEKEEAGQEGYKLQFTHGDLGSGAWPVEVRWLRGGPLKSQPRP